MDGGRTLRTIARTKSSVSLDRRHLAPGARKLHERTLDDLKRAFVAAGILFGPNGSVGLKPQTSPDEASFNAPFPHCLESPAKRPMPPPRERAPYADPIFRDPNSAKSAEMAALRDQLVALWAAPVHDHGGETRILAGMRRLLELRTKA